MKDIKDYLHLYLGCKFLNAEGNGPFELCGYNIYEQQTENSVGRQTFDVKGIKLILRPLSDMMEEEALYCISTFDRGVDNPVFKIIGKDELGEDWVYVQVGYEETECCWGPNLNYMGAEMFRYLLSRGLDLFDLIKSGLAIDKTSIPSNQEMK